jgi:adenylyl cyclase-associated protein
MSDALLARLEAVATRLENATARHFGGGSGDDDEKASPMVIAYNAVYDDSVAPFIATCRTIGGGVESLGDRTEVSFKHLGVVMQAASKCKKPSQGDLMNFIKPIVDVVTASQDVDNRSPNVHHEKAYAEIIQLMNWLLMPGPSGVVSATLEASDFYLNKILVAAKDLDGDAKQQQRDFVSQAKTMIKDLADYVKEFHKMGVSWKVNGSELSSFSAGGSSTTPAAPPAPAVPAAPAAPPAPPAPPAPAVNASAASTSTSSSSSGGGGGMADVFAEINRKRDAAAAGMRHVTKDMKTKNQPKTDSKVSSLASKFGGTTKPKPKPAAKPVAAKPKKDPVMAYKNGTWFVEHYDGASMIEAKDAQMKHNVYICNCKNTTIVVPVKVKAVTIDNCKKCRIQVSNVVSTIEVINSTGTYVYISEAGPTVAIDKSDGIHVHAMAGVTPPILITSKISECTMTIPNPKGENEDPIEQAIPEQFETLVVDGKLVTRSVAHG